MQEIPESYDELPLWSAPFGLVLLDTIRLRQGMKVLDVGSGHGFPMLEIADRLGSPGHVTGLEPQEDAIRIVRAKITRWENHNATIRMGFAEEMPFDDDQFDLITSNNGLNNVEDQSKAFGECYRVARPGAQMVITMNLPHTMIEFYGIFEQVLLEEELFREAMRMKEHIASKRKPIEFLKDLIIQSGFTINSINPDGFRYRFAGAEALFRHNLIRNYFLSHWEAIVPFEQRKEVMNTVRQKIDRQVEKEGNFTLSVPFVCFDCVKNF